MFNELTTGSYRIPWLIWIQLIVLILLFALFYFFTIVFDDDAATVSALPETSSASTKGFLFEEIQQIDNDSIAPVSTNRQHQITLEGGRNRSIKGEKGCSSSMRSGEIMEAGESSTKLSFHPCQFFQSATVAFLKCFGLDSTSDETSSNRKRRKRKES
ncbi:uncharacterized protein LOC123917559 isoform X1 [Trifolium pratense]|nr:uncharacterized protein LOC123917402 [Trifolium pratense]XP_045825060.1 uncharacterized protein LOC123917402 [Trifolium pratense]XP_045825270.1 uncharacterized protein LOC123917559 isoform X1 [Trifolium pratense]XP_045825271.1 uncharacterized protein LOC123917559 isoform X1 [Trifolium pratense]